MTRRAALALVDTRGRVPAAWPRGQRADVAAAYVGMSESLFLREVKESAEAIKRNRGRRPAGSMPQAVYLTPGCPVWLKEDLDRYLDEKAGRSQPDEGANEWMRAVRGED